MSIQIFTQADFPGMEKQYRTNLINSLSGFKSVTLVGSLDAEGTTNLAIFSQIFHLGANPALMGMIVRPDSVPRHTLRNILATGSYTFNHVREEFYRQAHQTSARYEQSEFEACGFTPQFSARLKAPYVREAQIKIGLQFRERVDLPINGTVLVIGEVVEVIVPQDCLLPDGFLDLERAGSLTGSGLDSYHRTQRLARLSYAKPDREVQEL